PRDALSVPRAESFVVAPRRELGSKRLTDANDHSAVAQLRHPNLIRRHALLRVAIELLALFDGFPALLKWRKIPLPATRAHRPQPATRLIKREKRPNGKM